MNDRLKNTKKESIFICVGEHSADLHAAALAKELFDSAPQIEIFGMGGSRMREAGVDTVVDSESEASVMGLTEVFSSLAKLYKAFGKLEAEVKLRQPKVAVFLDFPDFNFLLLRRLKKQGIKTVYFICPQVWAWRTGRIKWFKRYVDRVAAIFPFEKEFYEKHGVDVKFVGHPFLSKPAPTCTREEFLSSLGISSSDTVLGLLPGSRKAEVERLLVPMLEAFRLHQKKNPSLKALVPIADSLPRSLVENIVGDDLSITLLSAKAREVLAFSDASVITSGTATVEAAISGRPFSVCYKLSAFSYWIGKLLVRGVDSFSMVNLIAGKKVVSEYLQEEVTVENLEKEIDSLLNDNIKKKRIVEDLLLVKDMLAAKDSDMTAVSRVSRTILSLGWPQHYSEAGEDSNCSSIREVRC